MFQDHPYRPEYLDVWTLMSWVALLVVPFVLAYQAWSYWVFRRRLSRDHIPLIPQHGAAAGGNRSP